MYSSTHFCKIHCIYTSLHFFCTSPILNLHSTYTSLLPIICRVPCHVLISPFLKIHYIYTSLALLLHFIYTSNKFLYSPVINRMIGLYTSYTLTNLDHIEVISIFAFSFSSICIKPSPNSTFIGCV